jgi:hypothetical protein
LRLGREISHLWIVISRTQRIRHLFEPIESLRRAHLAESLTPHLQPHLHPDTHGKAIATLREHDVYRHHFIIERKSLAFLRTVFPTLLMTHRSFLRGAQLESFEMISDLFSTGFKRGAQIIVLFHNPEMMGCRENVVIDLRFE